MLTLLVPVMASAQVPFGLTEHTLDDLPPVRGPLDVPRPHGCVRLDRFFGRPKPPGHVSLTSATHPIKVWYDDTHPNSIAIAPMVLATAELSWDVQVGTLGFRPPTLPDAEDGPELDIYLVRYAPWAAYVTWDGFTDTTPGDGYFSTSTYMVIDHRIPPAYIEGYVAHEFNHTIQFSYDITELSATVWEATATASEKWTLGTTYDWENPVDSFQELPFYPTLVGYSGDIYYTTGLGFYFEYGAAMWVMWLDEQFGVGDGTYGPVLWDSFSNEGLGREPDVVDGFAQVAGNVTLGQSLGDFAVARFLTGDDWDSRGLVDAWDWPVERKVPAAPLTADDLPLVDWRAAAPPMITGQAFVDVDLTSGALPVPATGAEQVLVASITAPGGEDSALTLMWWDATGAVGHAVAEGAAPTLEIPVRDLERAVLAVTNLGVPGWDGDDDPYVLGSQLLSIDVVERALPGETGETGETGDTGEPPSTGVDPTEPTTDAPDDETREREAEVPGGCGCSGAGRGAAAGWWLALALALIRARRAGAPRTGA